jgi:hypothetical protein
MRASHRTGFKSLLLVLTVTALLVGVGCYKNKNALAPRDAATIDRALAGDWQGKTPDGASARVVVRVLNDRDYYVEWQGESDEKPARAIAYIVDFAGAKFAHLRDLNPDGTVADEHWLMRVELAGDKLIVRQLKEEFFDGKAVDTTEKLREVVRANVNNDAMYDASEALTATRQDAVAGQ